VSVETASAMPSRIELSTENAVLESVPTSLSQAPAITSRHDISELAKD